jgi:hypothetical protein
MRLISVSVDSVWRDIVIPLIIAFFVAGIAAFWPWLQALQRGRKFQRIIRRELAEIAPHPEKWDPQKPWWEHAGKHFVHQELFTRNSISQNRDFLLSLNPTLVYQVSQLWTALEERNSDQWEHFLGKLAENRRVTSRKLKDARDKWEIIIKGQNYSFKAAMGIPTTFRQEAVLARAPQLFEKRFDAYSRLLPLTDYGPADKPKDLDSRARNTLEEQLANWFYDQGSGLLLSGRALVQFQSVRATLKESTDPKEIRDAFSSLRTHLKIDLGVRQPQERDVAMAWPEEERW